MSERDDTDIEITVRVHNSRSAAVTFRLEPWGREYPMASGVVFEVRAQGPQSEALLEVVHAEDSITVYGWVGSVLAVYHDGVDLDGGKAGLPVPGVPPGSSVGNFMRMLFGQGPGDASR
jgi:hypothetical protein